MMKKVHLDYSFNLRWIVRTRYLIMLFLSATVVVSQEVSPSPIQNTTLYSSLSSATLYGPLVIPTPSSLPQYTCKTGPDTQAYGNVLIRTNHIYLDISNPVNCSGVITSWLYCHYIIGFRNATSSLWPCVWRRANNSEELGYEIVGCNPFVTVPGDGESFRCRYHIPSNPDELITVEEGDYIGFYVPDSGLLPALSIPRLDISSYQLVRDVGGFTSFVRDSEMRNISCTPNCGRALLRAEIGMCSISGDITDL